MSDIIRFTGPSGAETISGPTGEGPGLKRGQHCWFVASRKAHRPCEACEKTGKDRYGEICSRCSGSGIAPVKGIINAPFGLEVPYEAIEDPYSLFLNGQAVRITDGVEMPFEPRLGFDSGITASVEAPKGEDEHHVKEL